MDALATATRANVRQVDTHLSKTVGFSIIISGNNIYIYIYIFLHIFFNVYIYNMKIVHIYVCV